MSHTEKDAQKTETEAEPPGGLLSCQEGKSGLHKTKMGTVMLGIQKWVRCTEGNDHFQMRDIRKASRSGWRWDF